MIERLTKILGDHPALVATLADASFADALADLTTEGVARYLLDQPDSFFRDALARVGLIDRADDVWRECDGELFRGTWLGLLEEAVKSSDTGTGYAMPEVVKALTGETRASSGLPDYAGSNQFNPPDPRELVRILRKLAAESEEGENHNG